MTITRAPRTVLACLVVAGAIAAAGCEFESPLTTTATRAVEPRLLGDWVSTDEDAMPMKVRRLDDSTYIVVCDGDLYRVHHSDLADTPFLSVQDIDSDGRKYTFLAWALSKDGTVLTLRVLRSEVVPSTIRDVAALQQAVRDHLRDPGLFGTNVVFRRAKA